MSFLDKWNKNKFNVYNSEEKTVLNLITKIGAFIADLSKGVDEKTDLTGDHKGSWQGLNRPTLSEEGMRSTVEKNATDISTLNLTVTKNTSEIVNAKDMINIKNNLNTPNIIAHRGFSSIAPENTIKAIELCNGKCWGVEIDVSVTVDGVWVLMHDDTIDRTTNGTGKVAEKTITELKTYKIDAPTNTPYYPNQTIPTLEEGLRICCKYGLVPIIEIKNSQSETNLTNLINMLKNYNLIDVAHIISFSLNNLVNCRKINERVTLQYVTETITEEIINSCVTLKNCGIDVQYEQLSQSMVNLAHSKGIFVGAWTTDHYGKIRELASIGVDYITTNRCLGGTI